MAWQWLHVVARVTCGLHVVYIWLHVVCTGKVEDAASSSVESDAGESEEDYQEDFEDEEGQASAAATAQKKTLQSRGSGAAGRKV